VGVEEIEDYVYILGEGYIQFAINKLLVICLESRIKAPQILKLEWIVNILYCTMNRDQGITS
jgi:hypothetical protein